MGCITSQVSLGETASIVQGPSSREGCRHKPLAANFHSNWGMGAPAGKEISVGPQGQMLECKYRNICIFGVEDKQ